MCFYVVYVYICWFTCAPVSTWYRNLRKLVTRRTSKDNLLQHISLPPINFERSCKLMCLRDVKWWILLRGGGERKGFSPSRGCEFSESPGGKRCGRLGSRSPLSDLVLCCVSDEIFTSPGAGRVWGREGWRQTVELRQQWAFLSTVWTRQLCIKVVSPSFLVPCSRFSRHASIFTSGVCVMPFDFIHIISISSSMETTVSLITHERRVAFQRPSFLHTASLSFLLFCDLTGLFFAFATAGLGP